jgi:hypothetical protein
MTAAQRRMLIIGLVPVLVLVVIGAAVTVSLIRGKLPYSYSASFAPGAQGVRVVSDVPAQLLASTDGQVHVAVDGSYAVAKPVIEVTTTGGLLTVHTSCPDAHCTVDVAVEVPTASEVQAKVDGASLDAVGVSSPLAVDVNDGSVDMTRLRSSRVSVDARRGSIHLLFDTAPDQVTATASDGSLTVQLPRTTTYAIDSVAAQGSNQLDIPNDQSSTHHVYLRTSYGSITVGG